MYKLQKFLCFFRAVPFVRSLHRTSTASVHNTFSPFCSFIYIIKRLPEHILGSSIPTDLELKFQSNPSLFQLEFESTVLFTGFFL